MNKLIASLILVASIASAAEQPSAPVGNQSSVPPGVSVEPPQGSFGVKACSAEGKPTLVVWVILKNGKGYPHGQRSPPEDTRRHASLLGLVGYWSFGHYRNQVPCFDLGV